jgi:hypothetical protein
VEAKAQGPAETKGQTIRQMKVAAKAPGRRLSPHLRLALNIEIREGSLKYRGRFSHGFSLQFFSGSLTAAAA